MTTPKTLEDWLADLLTAANPADRRTIGIAACGAGHARAKVTCDRCQPREVFFFTTAVVHLNARESAYRDQHPDALVGLHLPGDLRPARDDDVRGDRPIFWQTSTCGSCRAPIIWAVSTKGNDMPINATPDPRGNVVLVDQGVMRKPLALVLHTEQEQAEAPAESLHLVHFTTCPNAKKHRKR